MEMQAYQLFGSKECIARSGVAISLLCDLSGFPWKNLLQKKDLNLETVEAIISLKGTITPRDSIKLIDLALKLNNFDFVEKMVLQNTSIDRAIIVSKMRKKDIQTRSKLNSFIMSTPEGCAQLLLKAVEYFEFKVAEECLKAGSKSLKTRVDIISVLKSHQGSKEERQQRIEFIEKLLELGYFDPNEQIGEACPLDVVLALSKEYQSEKEKLVMLLLQHGASIKHCTYQRSKGTTLVHEATRFAIDSGKLLYQHYSKGPMDSLFLLSHSPCYSSLSVMHFFLTSDR